MLQRQLLLFIGFALLFPIASFGQSSSETSISDVRKILLDQGFMADDVADLVVKDNYRTAHNGMEHTILRQRWQGIEVFNGDIAIHRASDGRIVKLNNGVWRYCAKTADEPVPVVTALQALTSTLRADLPHVSIPAQIGIEQDGRKFIFDGSDLGEEPATVELMYLPLEGRLRLVWNVNHYSADGSHWWNVRIDAHSGIELDRNDWVSQCGFGDHPSCTEEDVSSTAPLAPAVANDMHVYPMPIESPNHGAATVVNAPWVAGLNGSPFGWYDTDGVAGAEYTYTRGNNVLAQEDANGNNGTGLRPDGGATLDFDFSINLTQPPANYQDFALTNLFYWNNIMHDVWYEYGFDEASGNFQQNNYGNGGAGADYVLADGQDGSGTNNANFGTPPDGTRPRMQMFLWNLTTPNRDGDLDNGIIAHEYGHGISTRLVGGPANSNCLNNAEQMGEGWSDYFGLMLTMVPGDTRTGERGIGTYVLGESVTGPGIRPAPYTTNMGANGYTYADINSVSIPHGVGFVWTTMLWEMTWDLIDAYGFDPDLYNGTGGNNIAMQLVIDGLKLTPCSPGFVDARDAILAADVANNGGANQNLIWSAFARRGLGFSATQGSTNNTNDQTETYDVPLADDIGISVVLTPGSGDLVLCGTTPLAVSATLRNFGLQPQSGFNVRYSLDGAPFVTEAYVGTLAAGASETFTFAQTITINTTGPHSLSVSTVLIGDEYPGDDASVQSINGVNGTTVSAPLVEDVESGPVTPAGWSLQNPDNGTTWVTATVTEGVLCASTTAWTINYYSYNAPGQEDRLVTPQIDLSSTTANHLLFDHAYARYSATYFDGLRVEVSADCGSSWVPVFDESGTSLATAADNTGANWEPADCSDWTTNDIDLSAYDGQVITLRFAGVCGYGQRLCLDNVNVSGTVVETVYFSRGNGTMSDPIWSTTRIGTPAVAIWDGSKDMTVQIGNTITVTGDHTVKAPIVETGGALVLNGFTTLTATGDLLQVDGTISAADNSAVVLNGTGNTTIIGTSALDLWDLETNTPAGTALSTPLSIRGTLQLTDGSFDASASSVTLVSNASTTGRLGAVAPTADFIGDLTMERYIPSGATNWRFLGSPVDGATVQSWNDDFITAGFPGSDYPNFDSPVGSGILWPSIRWYNEPLAGADQSIGITGVPNTSQLLGPGQGFAAWCGDSLGGTAEFKLDVNGAPNIASTPIALPMTWTGSGNPTTDGWNLVSNPLPSAVLFSDITLGADVAGYITYYDPSNGNTAAYDKVSQISTGNATDVIQSSQGFWLKATGPSVTTTIGEAAKIDDNSGGFFGGDQINIAQLVRLQVSSAINELSDETVIHFGAGSPGSDPADVLKFVFAHPAAPQIATGASGTQFAINAYGPYNAQLAIPVFVNVAINGTYTISASNMENLGLTCLTLEDLETGATSVLAEGSTVDFTINASDDPTAPRFILHGTAPMDLHATDASCYGVADGLVELELGSGNFDINVTDASGSIIQAQAGASGSVSLQGMPTGQLMIHVSGIPGCGELSQAFSIQAPAELEITALTRTAPQCVHGTDGSILFDVLGGTEPYTFLWSDNSTDNTLVGEAGSYAVSVTDAHGCTWTSPVMDIPSAQEARADFYVPLDPILVGTEVFLANNSQLSESWSWDFGDGNTSTEFQPVHIWEQPGIYAVELTASSRNCSDILVRNVTVETATGVQGDPSAEALRVWNSPNAIVVTASERIDHVELIDALGQLVSARSSTSEGSRLEIPNADLPSGIWFVRVTMGTQQHTFRVPLMR